MNLHIEGFSTIAKQDSQTTNKDINPAAAAATPTSIRADSDACVKDMNLHIEGRSTIAKSDSHTTSNDMNPTRATSRDLNSASATAVTSTHVPADLRPSMNGISLASHGQELLPGSGILEIHPSPHVMNTPPNNPDRAFPLFPPYSHHAKNIPLQPVVRYGYIPQEESFQPCKVTVASGHVPVYSSQEESIQPRKVSLTGDHATVYPLQEESFEPIPHLSRHWKLLRGGFSQIFPESNLPVMPDYENPHNNQNSSGRSPGIS